MIQFDLELIFSAEMQMSQKKTAASFSFKILTIELLFRTLVLQATLLKHGYKDNF